jgi:hypothetical protein
MAYVTNNKKYLMLVPLFFIMLTASGVLGIVMTSLQFADIPTQITITGSIEPGEFDGIFLVINPDVSDPLIKIELTSLSFDFQEANLHLVEANPSSLYTNFSSYEYSQDYNSSHLLSDYGVVNNANFQLSDSYSNLYLLVENAGSESSSWSLSIRVSDGSSGNDTASLILKVIGVSLFTLAMLLLTIFSSIELAEPEMTKPRIRTEGSVRTVDMSQTAKYKAKFLTKDLDIKIDRFIKKTESWEQMILVFAYFGFPIGISLSIITGNGSLPFLALAGAGFVYYNVNKRLEFRSHLKSRVSNEGNIKLDKLAKMLDRKEEDVKRELFHLISYEQFPARYDFESNTVIYKKIEGDAIVEEVTEPVVSTRDSEIKTEPVDDIMGSSVPETKQEITCAFCGAKPTIEDARFCSECGASMVIAK